MTDKFSKLLPFIFGVFGLFSLVAVATFFLFSPPQYGEFSPDELSGYHNFHPDFLRYADKQQIVLYFSAPWCVSCKILEEDISKNQQGIPSDVTILKVDYDTHFALRRQYFVTAQHTLILLDSDENEIQRFQGTENFNTVLQSLGVTAP